METWHNSDTFLLWISIIIGVMIFLVGILISVFFIFYKRLLNIKEEELQVKLKHQQSLMKVSLDTQERERIRIASDLHDNIISKLVVIRLKVAIEADYEELDTLLSKVISESRRISHDLSPPLYEENSLEELLIGIVRTWEDFYNINTYLDVRTETNIKKSAKLQLVRIIQELLNNIHKHAQATHISFSLRITQNCISFVLKDNGIGYKTNAKRGIGIQNIELRANNLNALFKYKSILNSSTTFILLLHLNKNI